MRMAGSLCLPALQVAEIIIRKSHSKLLLCCRRGNGIIMNNQNNKYFLDLYDKWNKEVIPEGADAECLSEINRLKKPSMEIVDTCEYFRIIPHSERYKLIGFFGEYSAMIGKGSLFIGLEYGEIQKLSRANSTQRVEIDLLLESARYNYVFLFTGLLLALKKQDQIQDFDKRLKKIKDITSSICLSCFNVGLDLYRELYKK
jgi:hypothetical protein